MPLYWQKWSASELHQEKKLTTPSTALSYGLFLALLVKEARDDNQTFRNHQNEADCRNKPYKGLKNETSIRNALE